MQFHSRIGSPHRQRSAVLTIPQYDDELLALCQYEHLRQLNKAETVTLGWLDYASKNDRYIEWHTANLSWQFIRDFPRGLKTLYYKKPGDDDWKSLPVDDFTPRKKLLEFLATLRLLDPGVEHWQCFDWRDVLKQRGVWSLSSYVTAPVSTGKRSSVIWKIGRTLVERGASAAEIACVLLASKCWQSKHGQNLRALKRQVARMIERSA